MCGRAGFLPEAGASPGYFPRRHVGVLHSKPFLFCWQSEREMWRLKKMPVEACVGKEKLAFRLGPASPRSEGCSFWGAA